MMLLQNYVNNFEHLPAMNLHKDMVAKYLECGSDKHFKSNSLHGCLEKLSCLVYDESVELPDHEMEIANM